MPEFEFVEGEKILGTSAEISVNGTCSIASVTLNGNGSVTVAFPDGSSVEWPSIAVLERKIASCPSDRELYEAMAEILRVDPTLSNTGQHANQTFDRVLVKR